MSATIQDLIDAHVRFVRRVLRNSPETIRYGQPDVDPEALRCVLRRQADVLVRSGYEASELILTEDGHREDWWCVQVVPCSVMRQTPMAC